MPPRRTLCALLAVAAIGCDHSSVGTSASGSASALPLAVTAPLASAPAPVVAPTSGAAAAQSRGHCEATHKIAAGETLAGISLECYGSRAYADRLRKVNKLSSAGVKAGSSLATPPLQELFTGCAPREVCTPIFAAYEAFLSAQALTEHASAAPESARAALARTKQRLEAALRSMEAKKVTKSRTQIKAAISEIETLQSGTNHEPGYPEHTFHQHMVFALEAISG